MKSCTMLSFHYIKIFFVLR